MDADASITGCSFLVAETGTICFVHEDGKYKSSVLLPPVHITIAFEEQMLETFDDVFERIKEKNFSSLIFITGPSKTADIEKIIVTGVHGPGKVYLVLVYF